MVLDMVTKGFEAIVGTYYKEDEEQAIEFAKKKLSSSTVSEKVAHVFDEDNVFDVTVYGSESDEVNLGVGVCFHAEFESEESESAFYDALWNHYNVETCERVHYEPM